MVACTSCHFRKLKCDDTSPCRSCIRTSTECSRLTDGPNTRTKVVSANAKETINWTDVTNDNDPNRNSSLSQPWFHSGNPISPLPPYSDATPNPLFPTELTPNGILPWTQYPSDGGSLIDLFSMPLSDDTSMPIHAFNDPLKPWMDITRYDGEPSDRTISTFASQSPLSSSSSEQDYLSELRRTLNEDHLHMHKLLEVYFAKIHTSWPILHAPTFNPQKISPILLGSMLMLANLLDGDTKHTKIALVVFEAILAARLVVDTF